MECAGHGDWRPSTTQDELNAALNQLDAIWKDHQDLKNAYGLLQYTNKLLVERLQTWGDSYGSEKQ